MEIPTPQTKQIKVKRLSEASGEDVIFTLKELPYSRVAELRKITDEEGNFEIQTLLAGLVEPDLKNKGLLDKYAALTPAELVKKLLLPGEVADLSREVERLCGYRMNTLEELKKK